MRTAKLSVIIISLVSLLFITGCSEELQQLRLQNEAQAKRIDALSAELRAAELQRSIRSLLFGQRTISLPVVPNPKTSLQSASQSLP